MAVVDWLYAPSQFSSDFSETSEDTFYCTRYKATVPCTISLFFPSHFFAQSCLFEKQPLVYNA